MIPLEPWAFYLALTISLAGVLWRLRRGYLDRSDDEDEGDT